MGEVASIEVAEIPREERLEFPDERLARTLAKTGGRTRYPRPTFLGIQGCRRYQLPCSWQPGSGMDREGGVLNGPAGRFH